MNSKDTHLHQNIDDPKEGERNRPEKKSSAKKSGSKSTDHYTRPLGEDDDGYHPWSDRPAENPRWEVDPWR